MKKETNEKKLVYDLNDKFIKSNIIMLTIAIFIVGGVIFGIYCLSFPEYLRVVGITLVVAPCSFLLGGIGCIISIINNIRLLKYKKKELLIVTEDKIQYDAYLNENIIIEKDNIKKINLATFYNDFNHMVFLRVQLNDKLLIKATQRKGSLFYFNRTISEPKDIYINIVELKGDYVEIVKNISQILNIEIKPNKNILPDYSNNED